MDYAVGIDLGGSSVKAVAITAEGEILGRENQEFDADQQFDFAKKITGIFHAIRDGQGREATCVGLAAPGLAARDQSAIAFMPGRLRGLEGLNWTDHLNATRFVPVLNDAHAALLGEAWIGAAKGLSNVIMLTLGTGVGGAAIVDGRLLRGHLGRAGHLGHNCLDMHAPKDVTGIPGSIEYFIGNWNIQERTNGRFSTTHALVQAYNRGDLYAREAWERSIHALACTLSTYANVLDPEAVILGGGIARSGSSLIQPLETALRRIEWQPGGHKIRLLFAQLGEFAGAIGAAHNALTQSAG
jgi:glucokinase